MALSKVLLPEPLPRVTPLEVEPLPLIEPLVPVLGLLVLGLIVLLPVPLVLPLPLVCAWAVEKASAVPAVRRATVRRRENIESSIERFPHREEDFGAISVTPRMLFA
jgi:hypothetical protein